MISYLKHFYHSEQFQPSPFALLYNPYYILRRRLYQLLIKNSSFLHGKTLDFGCGAKPYKNLFKTTEYIGVDIEISGHSHDQENIDVFYDGKTIPFPEQHFDSIFTSEVFEHIFNLNNIVSELHRVLKPGGYILITIPFVWDEHEAPYDFARYTSYGIKDILQKNNFEIVKLEKSSTFIEVIFQMKALYLSKIFSFKNIFLTLLLQLIFVAPITLIGVVLSKLLPNYETLYLNTVIVAKRKA